MIGSHRVFFPMIVLCFIKMRFTDGKELTLEVPLKSRIVFEAVAPGLLMENGVEPGEATHRARLLAEQV